MYNGSNALSSFVVGREQIDKMVFALTRIHSKACSNSHVLEEILKRV